MKRCLKYCVEVQKLREERVASWQLHILSLVIKGFSDGIPLEYDFNL
jgi:hypothetical protein